jgi:hypothetical protein
MSGDELSIVELVQISHYPEMAFGFPISVQEYSPSKYEERMLTSLICNLVGIGITRIGDIRKVGSVLSVDVSPFQKKDPTLLICSSMNLSAYYEIWSSAVRGEEHWNGYGYDSFVFEKRKFGEAISAAIRSARNLTKEEIMFSIIEMLQFQNEMLCR